MKNINVKDAVERLFNTYLNHYDSKKYILEQLNLKSIKWIEEDDLEMELDKFDDLYDAGNFINDNCFHKLEDRFEILKKLSKINYGKYYTQNTFQTVLSDIMYEFFNSGTGEIISKMQKTIKDTALCSKYIKKYNDDNMKFIDVDEMFVDIIKSL